ncbi:GGDEF/EAL domain-containing response regulator [Chitiniphilus eburneus]|uniref:EAL domain-containing protein n=1 Tax=Chitiniphilus eburneus TaxID=2571148 RepID=A0A4U0Q573_9NEIS|nr:EAL domain-containing protein [Chitiniphilus eburneus]TJZ76307.1 EAL domain-containing protein [Chitiniphilus eburneus]
MEDSLKPLEAAVQFSPYDPPLSFAGEEEGGHEEIAPERWRILVVDDEPDVHLATTFALKDEIILDRPLELLHAYSGDEALQMLSREPDIAVVLLDVVMNGSEDGLAVAHAIRHQLNLKELRIVLRTGHPGYAPEYAVIRDYGINDYKTKSELTQIRLQTTLTTAIRSYQQLKTVDANRRGLEMIIEASASLFERRTQESFAAGALAHLIALLGLPHHGLIAIHQPSTPGTRPPHAWLIASAAGKLNALVGQPLAALEDPLVLNAIEHAIRSRSPLYTAEFAVLYLNRPHDQEAAIYLSTQRPLAKDERQLLEVFCTNIAVGLENVALFRQLQDLAYIDPLTYLPNRTQFVTRLDNLLKSAEPDEVVVLLDIAQFSQINDALGHLIGDQLLQSVAQRLRPLVPATATLARLGVDLFGVVGHYQPEQLTPLFEAFERPFAVASHRLRVQISCAAAHLRDTEPTGIGCLKDVTIALNQAKRADNGQLVWYSPSMSRASRRRLDLLHDLESAIHRGQLTIHYQPQIALDSGEIVGVEALARWPQPDGSFIPPDRFIPLAEQSGLILDLGNWLVTQVCGQLSEWRALGLGALRMAINVSMVQFNHEGLIDLLADALQRHSLSASLIEVEITESVAMARPEEVMAKIARLKALGVSVAIDDFGTGFSSLAYLQKLHADRLKIDRAFIRDMGLSENPYSIAEMVINLGHKLGIKVLAEGVESPAQATLLRSLGCDEAQGFLFAKPAPPAPLTHWFLETGLKVAV